MSAASHISPVRSKSIDDLKQIFPSHDLQHLREVLDRSHTIDDAVANLLDEDILDVPIFEGKRTVHLF